MNNIIRSIQNGVTWIQQNVLKFILAVVAVIVIVFGIRVGLALLAKANIEKANTSAIVSMTAEPVNPDKEYKQGEEIKISQFTITAQHANGMETPVSENDVHLNKSYPDYTGETTNLIFILNSDETIIAQTQVQNSRKAVFYFSCGTPNIDDVHAVYYSNGELCFEGKGDVLQYTSEEYPWKSYDGQEDNPIVSVSFEENITPKNLDGWFSNMSTLVYVKNIPDTVESMWDTFANDISLKYTPDWSKCQSLKNLKGTFYGCSGLESVTYQFPETVTNASNMFYGCTSLQQTPDFKVATSLENGTSMFEECSKLRVGEVAIHMKYMDAMFKNCINLREMPEIPDTVLTMNESFSGCTSMETVTVIPEYVSNVSNCFYGCDKINGMLWVDANPESYDGFLNGACVATTVDLQGNSDYLDILANTGTENNITVFGKSPDNTLNSINDFQQRQEEELEAQQAAEEQQAEEQQSYDQVETSESVVSNIESEMENSEVASDNINE